MTRQRVRDFGTALRMGSTSSVTVSGTTPTVTTGVTICAWVNSDLLISKYGAGTTARIVRTTDDNIDLFIRQTGPNLEWKLTTTQGSSPRPTTNERYMPPNTWHHIICQYDKNTTLAEIYVDNTLNATSATPSVARDGTNLSSNNTWSVGDTAGTAAFKGMIDEVQVFNSAFTAAQRADAYYRGIYPSTGSVFYYKFNEGSGTSATDSSGNGKTGTISNSSYSTDVAMKARSANTAPRPKEVKLLASNPSSPDTDGHNGIMTDGTNFYACGDPQIKKFDANWNLLATNSNAASDAGTQHLGDGQYYNGFLYIAAENYSSPVSYDHQRIAKYNASDLSLVTTYDISAQGYEISGLTIDSVAGEIYVSSFVQSDRIAKYSLASPGTYLGDIRLSQTITQTQCITYHSNRFYLGANGMTPANAIWEVERNGFVTGKYARVVKTNQEGLDWSTGVLYALDEQGTNETVWTVYPVPVRQSINGNIIYNSDFSRQPGTNTNATTSDDRWIDGTTTGSYITFSMDSYYGWATNNAAFASSAQFDTSKGYNAMHLSSVSAGTNMEVAPYSSDTAANRIRYGFQVDPSTSYTLTYSLETTANSGDSNDGAYMFLREYNNLGSTTATTLSGTKVKTTTAKTVYTLTITTNKATRYICPVMTIVGNSGAATLNMEAYFSSLSLARTTPITRTSA